jgi:hypothetical protein
VPTGTFWMGSLEDEVGRETDAAGLDACDGEGSGVECIEAGSPCDCTGYRPPTYPLVSPTRMGRPRCRRG